MKKIILLALLFVASLLNAKTSIVKGNLSHIAGESKINVEFNYSDASIMGLDENEFREYIEGLDTDHYNNSIDASVHVDSDTTNLGGNAKGSFQHLKGDEQWENIKKEWTGKFCESANSVLQKKGIFIGKFKKANILMKVNVEMIDKSGLFVADVELIQGGVVFAKIHVSEEGGTVGSVVNLMGDGHEHAGEALGKVIKRNL